jgi:hypothetical protein
VADSTETAICIDSEDEKLASDDNDLGEGDNESVEADNEPAEPETFPSMMEPLDRETPTKRTPPKRGRPRSLSSTGLPQAAKSKKEKRKSKSKPKLERVLDNQKERDEYFEPGYLVYGPWPGKKPALERKLLFCVACH